MIRDEQVDYSDAWREGCCDGLLKAIKVATRADDRSMASQIALMGVALFPSKFSRFLAESGYTLSDGELVKR
jgi:hypothetical protein